MNKDVRSPEEAARPLAAPVGGTIPDAQLRALGLLHEDVARGLADDLSRQLHRAVDVRLAEIGQQAYSEFIFSRDQPSCLQVVRAAPLRGSWLLEIELPIFYPIIDCLLGGGKYLDSAPRRAPTEIELRLISRIVDALLGQLRRAWEHVLILELAVERVEANPQKLRIVPPGDPVVVLGLETTIGPARGMLNLCLPCRLIDKIASKLTAEAWEGVAGVVLEPPRGTPAAADLVPVTVTLAVTRLSTDEAAALTVGTLIRTERESDAPLEVHVNGIPRFHARGGLLHGRRACRIETADK